MKDVAAKSSVPGGGSVASLVFCLGISLIQMAIIFSARKGTPLSRVSRQLERCKNRVFPSIDSDGIVFQRLLAAKGSKEKKRALRDVEKMSFDEFIKSV